MTRSRAVPSSDERSGRCRASPMPAPRARRRRALPLHPSLRKAHGRVGRSRPSRRAVPSSDAGKPSRRPSRHPQSRTAQALTGIAEASGHPHTAPPGGAHFRPPAHPSADPSGGQKARGRPAGEVRPGPSLLRGGRKSKKRAPCARPLPPASAHRAGLAPPGMQRPWTCGTLSPSPQAPAVPSRAAQRPAPRDLRGAGLRADVPPRLVCTATHGFPCQRPSTPAGCGMAGPARTRSRCRAFPAPSGTG